MYRNVLIPTDGATGIGHSIEEGVGLAADFGAAVHALHVIDAREYGALSQRGAFGLDREREVAGREAVDEIVSRANEQGVDATAAIERGIPHEEILAYADRNAVDLIVMATHARTGLDRFLLGSVTEKVVRSADAPVLVVRTGEADEKPIEGEVIRAETGKADQRG